MDYLEFKRSFVDKVCFSTHQIQTLYPGFVNNNLTRWVKKGLLVKLRNGYYAFPEYLSVPGSPFYIANRIYRPSYVSLQSALAFYGFIPEAISQVTCVSSLKTAGFDNRFGTFSYKSVLPALMFGYVQKSFNKFMSALVAQPEKALLDLLYLYSFYNSADEIQNLRLDEDLMHGIIDKGLFLDLAVRFNNKALSRRVNLLIEIYRI